MQKGVFITNPFFSPTQYPPHWGKNGPTMGFNSKEREFEPFGGILHFGKTIFVPSDCVKVMLRATALGVFDLFINGERVTNNGIQEELKPEWTDFNHRVFEISYDVTSYCNENTFIEAEVSPGWWSGRISWGVYGYKTGAFCAEAELTFYDGHIEIIPTDESWQTTIAGPVMRADIWDGEYYDARIPHPAKVPTAHQWVTAVPFKGFEGQIVEKVGDPIVVKPELVRMPQQSVVYNGTVNNGTDFGKIRILSQKQGNKCENCILNEGESLILDMGQNFVGRPHLCFRADRGTKLRVLFGEMLNDSGELSRGNDGPEGSVYLKNYRSAASRIVYISSGGEQSYYPTHTFFGFRYMEITVYGTVEIKSCIGEVLGTYLEETGKFSCDNDELNRLFENIVWGMRSNYFSNPTDCPQRDERFGWTGDAQLFCGAASYLANIELFMRKWLGDLRDSQIGYDGVYADMAPRIFSSPGGNAAWGDAGIVIPYRLWLMYGSTDILSEHYASMESYMDWLSRKDPPGPKTDYGDWLSYASTDQQYISAAYYAYDALLMSKMSRALGKTTQAEKYSELYERIKYKWHNDYFSDSKLKQTSQTAYLLALSFGLVDGEDRKTTIKTLERAVIDSSYVLNTGFIGTSLLCKTLYECGLQDLAYNMMLQPEDPGWLYSVRQGATTVWERWNSYTKAKGFGDVNMNSFNHYAYGAVAEWFFSGICGILPDEEHPGFEHFTLAPMPDMRDILPEGQKLLNHAKAEYESRYGTIVSTWTRTENGFRYEFTIPEGSTANVKIPCSADFVVINDIKIEKTKETNISEGFACFTLNPGKYTVTSEIQKGIAQNDKFANCP